MEGEIISIAPFARVIGGVITWGGFLLALGMMGSMISHGVSLALTELLIHLVKRNDWAGVEKITRWLGNGEDINAELQAIIEKIGKGDKSKRN